MKQEIDWTRALVWSCVVAVSIGFWLWVAYLIL